MLCLVKTGPVHGPEKEDENVKGELNPVQIRHLIHPSQANAK